MEFKKQFFEVIDSTNRYALEHECAHGMVIYTDEQTAGIGRFKRPWQAAAGMNVMMSICVDIPEESRAVIGRLALFCGLAVTAALQQLGVEAQVKWPNDVLVAGKKLAGILVETRGSKAVIGIGLNVNQLDFPDEVAAKATSLALVTGTELDRDVVMDAVLGQFAIYFDRFVAGTTDFVAEYERIMYGLGSWVKVDADQVLLLGIDASGTLRIRDEIGMERLVYSGAISFESVYADML
ncbi:biotin--[acetyl-CoA-carboxylase] ligase [Culicoidibacter larvae]|uniref:Biotin--[acetyl-CoA-carboxylase] ligase n=1 Tax=Culicoidibacter larvae TaxID=2579976 RepID=A0A5R8QI65_9FIRM|nr:biotin--[acetyl-CoA-carboxylase] ligase [Culicoidibacter larvae]TLG77380.1 biotin--[acetyl-CoA-carboxylase] ligase [Culicoidibacter larvae]